MPKEPDTGWLPGPRGAYKYGVRVHVPNSSPDGVQGPWSKDYVLLQASPRNGQGGYLRAEWNPARFNPEQKAHIFKSLDDYLDLPPPRVGEAKVTRADVAIDLPGVWIGDYAFERTKSPIRNLVFYKDELQTLYMGRRFHGQCRVYDKSAQMGDTTKELTRVEVCASPNRPAGQLHTLQNPFKSIRVTDLAKIDLGVGAPHMRSLRRAMRAEGMTGPLSDFPTLAAMKHKAAIAAAGATFWDPVALWETWPDAIAAAFLPFGQPDHYGPIDSDTSFVQSIAQSREAHDPL
ncbi:MAG: hypothetical protein WCP68_01450 [Enhydrobacter sp.]